MPLGATRTLQTQPRILYLSLFYSVRKSDICTVVKRCLSPQKHPGDSENFDDPFINLPSGPLLPLLLMKQLERVLAIIDFENLESGDKFPSIAINNRRVRLYNLSALLDHPFSFAIQLLNMSI